MAASASATARATLPGRLTGLAAKIVRKWVDQAKSEANADLRRIVIGLMSIMTMGIFAIHAVIFAHVLLVVGLAALDVIPLWGVVGVVFAADVVVVILAGLVGRTLLFQPLLPRTRRQLADAWQVLVG